MQISQKSQKLGYGRVILGTSAHSVDFFNYNNPLNFLASISQ